MIKVIAFDMVGVLVHENDIVLSEVEEKLERLLGDNISDSEYINKVNDVVNNINVKETIKEVFYKLYDIKDMDIFKKIKERYPNVKTLVATNNVSFVIGVKNSQGEKPYEYSQGMCRGRG